jgi:hypothetical protein
VEGEPLDRIESELRLMRELHARYMRESEEHIRGYRMMASRITRVVEENIAESRAHRRELQDLREESRAHRKAIYALLDRLDNGGGAAPATG